MVEDREAQEGPEPVGFQAAACRMEVVGVPYRGPFAVPGGQGDPSWEVENLTAIDPEVLS